MKKQVTHIGVMQCGKVFAGIYLVLAIPLVLFMLLGSSFGGAESAGLGIGGAIGMAILYPIFGFISGVIGAWLYNIVAKRIGGFEYTAVDVGA